MKQSKTPVPTPPSHDELYNLEKQKYLQRDLLRKRNSIEPTTQQVIHKTSRDYAQSQRSSPKQRKSSPTALKMIASSMKPAQASNGKKQPNQNRKSLKSQQPS